MRNRSRNGCRPPRSTVLSVSVTRPDDIGQSRQLWIAPGGSRMSWAPPVFPRWGRVRAGAKPASLGRSYTESRAGVFRFLHFSGYRPDVTATHDSHVDARLTRPWLSSLGCPR